MNEKKRIEYIDCMRGFTMILVVACHVAFSCLGISESTPSVHRILYEFRMPLFFFISGFVLYKDETRWTAGHIARFLIIKKFPVQIVTMLIFLLIYLKLNQIGVMEGIYSDSKLGYWFTFVLFIYFCIYSVCRYFLDLFGCKGILADVCLLSIGFLVYVLFFVKSVFASLPIDRDVKDLLSMCHWGYYFYFVIGTLFKKYYAKIQEILDNKPVLTICLVIFFGFNLFYDEMISTHSNILLLLTAITGIVIVFSFFRLHQTSLTKETVIGRTLQYIGRRTLDVYLLHYLLLPLNLKVYTTFLTEHPMPLLEISLTIIISLIVVAGCLLISRILCMSHTLSYLLFGVKDRK